MTEVQVIETVQRIFLASTAGEWAAIALARAWIFLYAPLVAWLWISGTKRERHAASEVMWSVLWALLLGEFLSLIVLRVRPFLDVPEIIALIPPPLTSSFPSLHTAASTAVTLTMFSVNRIAGWAGVIVLIGVALGRIAAGAHYPSDILGGLLIGFLGYALVRWGHRAVRTRIAMTQRRLG